MAIYPPNFTGPVRPQDVTIADTSVGANFTSPEVGAQYANPYTQNGQTFFRQNAPPPAQNQTTTTSDPATNYVNNLGNDINTGATTPPIISTGTGAGQVGYDPNKDPAVIKALEDAEEARVKRQNELKTQRDKEIERLTGEKATEAQKLSEVQANETGSSTRNLLYLQQGGQSASAQAYLNQLEVSHTREMTALNAKYNTAIQQAQNAFTDKDFELAKYYADQAKTIKDDAYKRNQDFIDNVLKIHTSAVNDAKFALDEDKNQQQLRQDIRDFNQKIGNTQPFYELAGTVFNSLTGEFYSTKEEFLKAGGKEDMSNVFSVKPNENKQYAGGDLGEFQYLVDTGVYQQGQFLQFLAQKQADRAAIARAGRPSISVGQQQFNLTQEQTAAIRSLSLYWKNNNYIAGNGTVDSTVYKKAKQAFVAQYGTDAGKAFDDAMLVYVDSTKPTYKNEYGLN